MDPWEQDRRVVALVHTAMLAAVGVYAVVLVFFRTEIVPNQQALRAGPSLFLIFAALGAAQLLGAWALGRRLLRLRRPDARDRVRLYFIIRAGAAEAIALFGFVLGFLGGPPLHVAVLFGASVAGLLSCSPGRPAWQEARQAAESPVR
jgi:F0F1-type ATP synthase membrane subunit c/vacuolar-type H+-ATPase subunit K